MLLSWFCFQSKNVVFSWKKRQQLRRYAFPVVYSIFKRKVLFLWFIIHLKIFESVFYEKKAPLCFLSYSSNGSFVYRLLHWSFVFLAASTSLAHLQLAACTGKKETFCEFLLVAELTTKSMAPLRFLYLTKSKEKKKN